MIDDSPYLNSLYGNIVQALTIVTIVINLIHSYIMLYIWLVVDLPL